jgi:hypothetical protein
LGGLCRRIDLHPSLTPARAKLPRKGCFERVMAKTEEGSGPKSFDDVLAEVSGVSDMHEEGSSDLLGPLAGLSLPLGDDHPPILGGAANWTEALSWMEPDEDLPEEDPPALMSDEGLRDAIAQELAVATASTVEELDQTRREFMWRNHPDRFTGQRRLSATKRASIANSLLDDARHRLLHPKR